MTKKNMSKKILRHHGFCEKQKKIFFRKTGLPAKPDYPENCETWETFFPWFFPLIKFSTSPYKKNQKSISEIRDVPKLIKISEIFTDYIKIAIGKIKGNREKLIKLNEFSGLKHWSSI